MKNYRNIFLINFQKNSVKGIIRQYKKYFLPEFKSSDLLEKSGFTLIEIFPTLEKNQRLKKLMTLKKLKLIIKFINCQNLDCQNQ
tara:strand:+ start:337 stop:591 length:255 start_codon:yes stop_codon:yes gene_type:complete